MARQNSALEFNSFIRGLVTEASPLTFPENASLDERNFVLLRDGSRRRRLGMDFEEDSIEISTGAVVYTSGEIPITTFRWSSSDGGVNNQIMVVQVGAVLKFFNLSASPLSSGLIHTHNFYDDGVLQTEMGQISFASVDGVLVCTTGIHEISLFEYVGGVITHSTDTLKIRDLFGVEDVDPISGLDLRESNNIAFRPKEIYDEHLYNLRNQSWAVPRRSVDPFTRIANDYARKTYDDPLKSWYYAFRNKDEAGAEVDTKRLVRPSNADTVTSALFPDSEDSYDRVGDRFWPESLVANPGTVSHSPQGHFIIDALKRGTSRLDALSKLNDRYEREGINPVFASYQVGSLPVDKTPGGATCLESFAGRVWFGGFRGDLVGGDRHSPRMSSYILFSKLVDSVSDVVKCYQDADPTSQEDPNLVDTDGGFVHLNGVETIISLVSVGSVLLVFASNGVWAISGGSDYGFSATNYRVDKITTSGISGPKTVVVVDNGAIYWSDDGIYSIQQNSYGQYVAENISKTTIQSFYQEIQNSEREYCRGFYDRFDRKVRWLYNNRPNSSDNPMEIVLDIDLGAFYVNEIRSLADGFPLPAAIVETSPYRVGQVSEAVTHEGVDVTFGGETVEVVSNIRQSFTSETKYVVLTSTSPVNITFAEYRDTDFLDWKSSDGVGIDSPAYLITGYLPGKDFQRDKQVPYVTMHFLRTEDGFYEDALGDIYPTKPSSCIMQVRWDWSNSIASNRWGREFQAYRYRRAYIPSDVLDNYDTGFETIVTKNKLRGKGKVMSFLMKTEPGKDCRIQGWSMIVGVNGNV